MIMRAAFFCIAPTFLPTTPDENVGADMDDSLILVFLVGVPVLGVAAQWISWRFRLPSILLLLVFGVALGRFAHPDHVIAQSIRGDEHAVHRLLFPLVSLAVAVILFEGGLTLRFRELKEAGSAVLRLCTIGAAVAWGLTTAVGVFVVGLSPYLAALLGAILVVTGPTVIAPLLRNIKPTKKISSILKWEGIVIDPIGAVAAVLVYRVIAHLGEPGSANVPLALLLTLAVGLGAGLIAGFVFGFLLKRYWIPEYLQSVSALASAIAVFAISNYFEPESGLIAVTVMGVSLANQKNVAIENILTFKEHLSTLFISCLFIVLGARVELNELGALGISGALFVALLIVVVRPASVYLSMIASKLNWREQTYLAFLAPRGIVAAAVSSVFALELTHVAEQMEESGGASLAALEGVQKIAPLTFLVIVGTVAFYGLLAAPLARWLKLAAARPQGLLFAGADEWVRSLAKVLHSKGVNLLLVDTNYRHIAAARMEEIPAVCASILSEDVTEDLDLCGIGRLLAVTPNDEVNVLAAHAFSHEFGRGNIFALPPVDTKQGRRESMPEHLKSRQLFSNDITFDDIAARFSTGEWEFKATKITDEFEYDDYRELYRGESMLLFVIKPNADLTVVNGEVETEPAIGEIIVGLVPCIDELQPASSSAAEADHSVQ